MQYQLSRKPLVQSNWTFHQGRFAIGGSLIVWSLFMLVFGVTSTTARIGQDARCADFTGQARGLCTAAVAKGCFDGVESRACDRLTTKWTERCRVCEGEAPWEGVPCPCSDEGTAVELNELFERLVIGSEIYNVCVDDLEQTTANRCEIIPSGGCGWSLRLVVVGVEDDSARRCDYRVQHLDTGELIHSSTFLITNEEVEACREDIRLLQAQLGCLDP